MNDRQQRFVDAYLIDPNATQAAITAGYSEKTARSQGQRLLTNADVAAALDKAKQKRAERTQITADAVLERLWLEAHGQDVPDHSQSGRVKALDLLAKHLKLYTDALDVTSGGKPVPALVQVAFVKATKGEE